MKLKNTKIKLVFKNTKQLLDSYKFLSKFVDQSCDSLKLKDVSRSNAIIIGNNKLGYCTVTDNNCSNCINSCNKYEIKNGENFIRKLKLKKNIRIRMNINFIVRITENTTSADLISIYLIDDNADSFYAEFNDFDVDKCSKVIIRSIVENLKFEGDEYFDNKDFRFKSDKNTISELTKEWLRRYDIIDEFIGDKIGFGWYHFLQLIG